MRNLKLFTGFVLLFVLSSSITYAQWTKQISNSSLWTHGAAIDACDSLTAVFSTFSDIYNTTDGGKNWQFLSNPTKGVSDISIIDSSHVWIGDIFGKIFSTHDGGQNWELQYYDTTKTKCINYIEMFDLDNGVAMGDHFDPINYRAGPSLILNTSDGGRNWISVNDSAFGGWSGDLWRRIDFVNPSTGYFYASGLSPSKLYKTVDGGYNWSQTNIGGYIEVLHFYNELIGLIIRGSAISRTFDGGNSWQTFQLSPISWGSDIEFAPNDPSKVWMTEQRNLYFSSDTGRTWTVQIEDCGGRDIVMISDKIGWLLGDNGKLYYTASQGPTAANSDYHDIPMQFELFQNYPNPFNASTTIRYSIAEPSLVKLSIFNLLGKEIKILVNERQAPGSYQIDWTAENLSSGTYFYRLEVGGLKMMRKLVLLK